MRFESGGAVTPAPRGEFVKLVERARWLVRVGTVAVEVAREAKRGDPRCTPLPPLIDGLGALLLSREGRSAGLRD